MTDHELVRRARGGDLDSFGALVDRHRGAVYGLAYHWTGSFADAEDIAQEACVRAYLRLDQLREPARFGAWLWQLARNECRQWRRRQRPAAYLEVVEDSLVSAEPTPHEHLERAEARDLVQDSLRRLSDTSRLVLSLHYLGGLSYEEIAQFLDLSTNAVAARLHRARKELEGQLMDAVEDSLRGEQLDEEFTRKVLEQARARARESQSRWQRQAFQVSVEQGLKAARQLQDREAEVEILSLQGDAASSWLGEAEQGVASYEAALEVARQEGDGGKEARLLASLYRAHLRSGNWDGARERAAESVEVCTGAGDLSGQALARAALDLAEMLPGKWQVGEAGGYAAAAFPCTVDGEGCAWGEVVYERRYSWSCPSRCAALMHLYRPRRFLGPDGEVGATWEDRLLPGHNGMSWHLDDSGPEVVARSEIISGEAVVVTPAGRFAGCLEVRTAIAPPGGGRGAEHSTRSFCGERVAWFAPGVGLVQVRHADQNGLTWEVQLAEVEGAGGDSCFPVEAGRTWRYRWREALTPAIAFDDVCRVVGAADGVAWIASATWGREETPAAASQALRARAELARRAGDLAAQTEALEPVVELCPTATEEAACRQELMTAYERRLEAARQTADLAEQASALRGIARHSDPGEQGRAAARELEAVCRQLGDEWGALLATQALRGATAGIVPEEDVEMLRERLDLARRLGDGDREVEVLQALAGRLRDAARYDEAAPVYEEHAAAVARSGDVREAASVVSQAELCTALAQQPDGEARAWWTGDAHLPGGSSSRSRSPERKDVQGWRTPITDLLQMVPLNGLGLLGGEVGGSTTDWYNTSVNCRPNYCESMRITNTLAAVDEVVTVAASRFTGCGRIDVSIATSEERPAGEDAALDAELGYYAGTKQAWFAPGVGLVKLTYHHQNGLTTEVELLEYDVAADGQDWLPLAVGNRWRYAWTEAGGGARFEEVWRVVARRGERSSLAFVTRAEVGAD